MDIDVREVERAREEQTEVIFHKSCSRVEYLCVQKSNFLWLIAWIYHSLCGCIFYYFIFFPISFFFWVCFHPETYKMKIDRFFFFLNAKSGKSLTYNYMMNDVYTRSATFIYSTRDYGMVLYIFFHFLYNSRSISISLKRDLYIFFLNEKKSPLPKNIHNLWTSYLKIIREAPVRSMFVRVIFHHWINDPRAHFIKKKKKSPRPNKNIAHTRWKKKTKQSDDV